MNADQLATPENVDDYATPPAEAGLGSRTQVWRREPLDGWVLAAGRALVHEAENQMRQGRHSEEGKVDWQKNRGRRSEPNMQKPVDAKQKQ
jgi:hypothetical protein